MNILGIESDRSYMEDIERLQDPGGHGVAGHVRLDALEAPQGRRPLEALRVAGRQGVEVRQVWLQAAGPGRERDFYHDNTIYIYDIYDIYIYG